MLRALIWKELRELAPFIGVTALAQVYLVSSATGLFDRWYQVRIPFLYDGATNYLLAAVAVACVVGLWQTAWESSRGTFLYLLHRPMERIRLIAVKLLIGLIVSLAAAVLPLAVYCLWAALPGTHASPFEWSMSLASWQFCVAVPLVYLGAFLSGLRPARWWGSRLFPLAAGFGGAMYVQSVAAEDPNLAWVILLVIVIGELCFVPAIFHVAVARDYS